MFLGVCDGSKCGEGPRPGQPAPDFPVVAYGSYHPLTDIARFDDRNEVLLLNGFWGVKKSLRRAPSVGEMAAEIQQVIQ